jgi:membrane-bound lytic murein transglycosylase
MQFGSSGNGCRHRGLRWIVAAGVLLFGLTAQSGHGAERAKAKLATRTLEPDKALPTPGPLTLPDTQLEPIDWSALDGWAADDHAAAFATLLASCRPLVRTATPPGETRPMYFALKDVCRRALTGERLAKEPARLFFERNFRPLRIARLGDGAGFLTGYYEPIVEGSRFPTPVFKVPIYRRPRDLVPPLNSTGPGFPNRGQSLRRTSSGELVPYYDRGQILDGALDGERLEICWIKDQTEHLVIQIQGSARVRLEDGVVVRINYDSHNGYPYVPVGRILIERNIIPREEMSMQRIREWMRVNPESAEEVRRQNRSFVFFRIVGLSDGSDEREAVGAQGVPLTAERSIAVDKALHVYGTPFFIRAGLPVANGNRTASFERLMIAQDTGSAIVGPARADIYWGSGERAGQLAGRLRHPGSFAMLVPRELDPVAAGAHMPLPPENPRRAAQARARAAETAETGARAPRLTKAQSDALRAYDQAVNDFKSILGVRRAQIDSKQKLPNLPGQALYRARNAMISAYKDLTDALPSRIGRPNKLAIPPAYFDADNEPLLDEYASLFSVMQAPPGNAQSSSTPFHDVVELGTAIARARGLDAANADAAGRISLGLFFAETNGNQNIGNARSNKYKGSMQTGVAEDQNGRRKWAAVKRSIAAFAPALSARDDKEEARAGKLDRRFNHWTAVRDGLLNAHADLFPQIPAIVKVLPDPIDQMKLFELVQIIPGPTKAAIKSGNLAKFRISDPTIMGYLRNNSMFTFGQADRAKTSATYREILDAMWLFNEKFERALAKFNEIKAQQKGKKP